MNNHNGKPVAMVATPIIIDFSSILLSLNREVDSQFSVFSRYSFHYT